MTIFKNSRYNNSQVVSIGDKQLIIRDKFKSLVDLNGGVFIYKVQAGDNLINIAGRFFGDDTKWNIIAEINDIVTFPLESLIPGQEIIVPKSLRDI